MSVGGLYMEGLVFGILQYLVHISISLQLHADLRVFFRNGHDRWILYPEGSIYSFRHCLQECSF